MWGLLTHVQWAPCGRFYFGIYKAHSTKLDLFASFDIPDMSHVCVCDRDATLKQNRRKCKQCFPVQHLHRKLYSKIREAVKLIGARTSPVDYMTYFGCSREVFETSYLSKIAYWNTHFRDYVGLLTPHNSQADHICPLSIVFKLPTIQLQFQASWQLCHYSNIQPLPAQFNRIKSNYWCPVDQRFWQDHIFMNPHFIEIYWPYSRASAGRSRSVAYLNTDAHQ